MPRFEDGSRIGAVQGGAERSTAPNLPIRSSADLTIFHGTRTYQENLPKRLAQEQQRETPLPRGRGRA